MTAKARSPMVERRVAGTRTSAVYAERSRRRESTSDSGWINSDRYCGAAPFRQRCTRTQSLYWMRSGTCSQCRFISSGVTPSVCLSVTYALRRLLMCVHKELRCSICHAALVTLDNSESWQVDVFIPSDIYTMHLEPWPMFSVVFPLLVLSCSFLPSLSSSTSYWTVQSNSSSST